MLDPFSFFSNCQARCYLTEIVDPGTLYVVGTPIGNLGDISQRALALLGQVDVIAAEDTRETLKLLRHHGLKTPLISHHAHNEKNSTPGVIKRLHEGDSVALVSDAGMPGISDPGEHLIRAAIAAEIRVIPVPGPTSFVTALVGSGLPTRRFVFEGFLPQDAKGRRRVLRALAGETRTLIFFEAPHRLLDTLADLQSAFGPQRQACVARELTKHFETFHRGTLTTLQETFTQTPVRGELVLVIAGAEEQATASSQPGWEEALDSMLAQGVKPPKAAREVANSHGISREKAYARAVLQRKPVSAESQPDASNR